MNMYFWFFAVYALLITPVGAQIHIRVEHGFHYRIRLRMAGLPVVKKTEKTDKQEEVHLKPDAMVKGIHDWDAGLFASLIHQGHLGRLFRLFDWHDIQIRARISFEDAAQTAMTYALIRTALQTLARIRSLPVKGGVEMDFQGRGSMLSFRGIAQTRLGSLMAAAIRLWLALLRHRRMNMEGEQYAAASH